MGNCVAMEKKMIKVMRNDGKIIEYKSPMKVHQILTQFSNHYSLFDSISNKNCHLHPQSKLLCGHLYYLLPKETTTIKHNKTKKKVRFANPEVEKEEDDNNTKEIKRDGIVRVKMVVSKQELEKLLQGDSVHEIVYRNIAKQHHLCNDYVDDKCHKVWRPMLDTLPESD